MRYILFAVIVPVHATLESDQSDNLDEVEAQVVKEMTAMLCRNTSSTEQANRLLAALQLQVIAAKRGESVVLYIRCYKENEFEHLCEVVDKQTIRKILERIFNRFFEKQVIKISNVAIYERDLRRAKESFAR